MGENCFFLTLVWQSRLNHENRRFLRLSKKVVDRVQFFCSALLIFVAKYWHLISSVPHSKSSLSSKDCPFLAFDLFDTSALIVIILTSVLHHLSSSQFMNVHSSSRICLKFFEAFYSWCILISIFVMNNWQCFNRTKFDVTAGKEPRFIRITRQHLDFFAPDSQLLIMFI